LPTYPFERQRYWIDPPPAATARNAGPHAELGKPTQNARLAGTGANGVGNGHPRPEIATPYVPPGGELECLLASRWQFLLGIEKIGRHDDFFELGGHSLLATQLLSRVRDDCHAEVPLARFFERPTVAALADLICELRQPDNGGGSDTIRRPDPLLPENLDSLSDAEVDTLLSELSSETRAP
jgi:hypothetical protein